MPRLKVPDMSPSCWCTPKDTSQICSGCKRKGPHKDLDERTHTCVHCGLVLDRDVNAAYKHPSARTEPSGESNPEKPLGFQPKGSSHLMVQIPMVGKSDSLNLAIATSVMLYEVFNQRRMQ